MTPEELKRDTAQAAHRQSTGRYASHDELDQILGTTDAQKLERLLFDGKGHTIAAQVLQTKVAEQEAQAQQHQQMQAWLTDAFRSGSESGSVKEIKTPDPRVKPEGQKPKLTTKDWMALDPVTRMTKAREMGLS